MSFFNFIFSIFINSSALRLLSWKNIPDKKSWSFGYLWKMFHPFFITFNICSQFSSELGVTFHKLLENWQFALMLGSTLIYKCEKCLSISYLQKWNFKVKDLHKFVFSIFQRYRNFFVKCSGVTFVTFSSNKSNLCFSEWNTLYFYALYNLSIFLVSKIWKSEHHFEKNLFNLPKNVNEINGACECYSKITKCANFDGHFQHHL